MKTLVQSLFRSLPASPEFVLSCTAVSFLVACGGHPQANPTGGNPNGAQQAQQTVPTQDPNVRVFSDLRSYEFIENRNTTGLHTTEGLAAYCRHLGSADMNQTGSYQARIQAFQEKCSGGALSIGGQNIYGPSAIYLQNGAQSGTNANDFLWLNPQQPGVSESRAYCISKQEFPRADLSVQGSSAGADSVLIVQLLPGVPELMIHKGKLLEVTQAVTPANQPLQISIKPLTPVDAQNNPISSIPTTTEQVRRTLMGEQPTQTAHVRWKAIPADHRLLTLALPVPGQNLPTQQIPDLGGGPFQCVRMR